MVKSHGPPPTTTTPKFWEMSSLSLGWAVSSRLCWCEQKWAVFGKWAGCVMGGQWAVGYDGVGRNEQLWEMSSQVCWCEQSGMLVELWVEQSGMLVAPEILLSALGLFRFSILDSQSQVPVPVAWQKRQIHTFWQIFKSQCIGTEKPSLTIILNLNSALIITKLHKCIEHLNTRGIYH